MGKAFGESSLERAAELSELSETEIGMFKLKLAEQHASSALQILNKLSQQTEAGGHAEYIGDRAKAESRLGQALTAQGFHEEAKPHFANAHDLIMQAPGFKQQDLADELRVEALFLRTIGQKQQSATSFERALPNTRPKRLILSNRHIY